MAASTDKPIEVVLPADRAVRRELRKILQEGFQVTVRTGVSLNALLVDELGIDPAYVSGRIQTIFMDDCPVDDLDRAMVGDGSRISLSAAMPGLVGATLRKGGVLASLRSSISHRETAGPVSVAGGTVTLKLFNLTMDELGEHFLARGIIIPAERYRRLVEDVGGAKAAAGPTGKEPSTGAVRLTIVPDARSEATPCK